MKYAYQEIENGVIIKGKLYNVEIGKNLDCFNCDLPFHSFCCQLCNYFDKKDAYAVFKRIRGNILLKLHEDEEG